MTRQGLHAAPTSSPLTPDPDEPHLGGSAGSDRGCHSCVELQAKCDEYRLAHHDCLDALSIAEERVEAAEERADALEHARKHHEARCTELQRELDRVTRELQYAKIRERFALAALEALGLEDGSLDELVNLTIEKCDARHGQNERLISGLHQDLEEALDYAASLLIKLDALQAKGAA